ncbi:MAG: hypothetical protein IT340_14105 [Chloroflexi bacterium]|nr:hypothetical protein [Chloroflexota bacterium]
MEASRWQVVVAPETEVRRVQVQRSWPCTDQGNSNRYLGCVGVRRCRAKGTETCIFGRWPTSSTRVDWLSRQ